MDGRSAALHQPIQVYFGR